MKKIMKTTVSMIVSMCILLTTSFIVSKKASAEPIWVDDCTIQVEECEFTGYTQRPNVTLISPEGNVIAPNRYIVDYPENAVNAGWHRLEIRGSMDTNHLYGWEDNIRFEIKKGTPRIEDIKPYEMELGAEKEIQFHSSINRKSFDIVLTSSNEDVIKITDEGKMKGVSTGSAEITLDVIPNDNVKGVTLTTNVTVVKEIMDETNISTAKVYTRQSDFVYGYDVYLDLQVVLGDENLHPSIDYEVKCEDLNKIGTHAVDIIGCGEYHGKTTIYITVHKPGTYTPVISNTLKPAPTNPPSDKLETPAPDLEVGDTSNPGLIVTPVTPTPNITDVLPSATPTAKPTPVATMTPVPIPELSDDDFFEEDETENEDNDLGIDTDVLPSAIPTIKPKPTAIVAPVPTPELSDNDFWGEDEPENEDSNPEIEAYTTVDKLEIRVSDKDVDINDYFEATLVGGSENDVYPAWYTSTKKAVASVDDNGIINPKKYGETWITVTFSDTYGTVEKTCRLKVIVITERPKITATLQQNKKKNRKITLRFNKDNHANKYYIKWADNKKFNYSNMLETKSTISKPKVSFYCPKKKGKCRIYVKCTFKFDEDKDVHKYVFEVKGKKVKYVGNKW